ncbi:MAG: sugar-transfer associated ATP-grasp domain-containing protein [Pseudomonadota bacterium]
MAETLTTGAAAQTGKAVDVDNPLADMRIKYFLHEIFEQTGRRPRDLIGEIFRMYFSKRKVSAADYFSHRLFDPSLSWEEKTAFVGVVGSSRFNRTVNWNGVHHGCIDTKTMLAAMLKGYGLRAAETQAVASAQRRHPQRTLSNAGELAQFLRHDARYPLFGKPVGGSQSLGVVSIDRYDAEADVLALKGVGAKGVDAFAEEIFETFEEDSYLLQDRIAPHPTLQKMAGDALGTVRVVTVRDGRDVKPIYAVWKIPAVGAIADNFWRDGNMLAHIDLETGETVRVQIGSGVGARLIDTHPGTGETLLGVTMPDWDAMLALVERAALAFPATPVIGWDMGLTDQGPLVVEGNTNPNHTLFQIAANEGLFAGERGRWFERMLTEAKAAKTKRKATRKQKQRAHKRRALKTALSSVLADK